VQPGAHESNKRKILPDYPHFTGFVFKLQENMDPKHRDKVAFVQEEAGWKLVHEDAFRPQIMQVYDQQGVLPSILGAEHAHLHGNNQDDIDRRQSIPTFQNYRQQVCK
jgi:hypothetical protein